MAIWKAHTSAIWLALVRIAVGYIWLSSGLEKLLNPNLIDSTFDALNYFSGENPYPWYSAFIENNAIPNIGFYAAATAWGETLVGISLVFGALTPLGALGALFLNVNFYLAAAWTSASTSSLNVLMIVLSIIILLSVAGQVLSIDQLLAHWWPRVTFWARREQVCLRPETVVE